MKRFFLLALAAVAFTGSAMADRLDNLFAERNALVTRLRYAHSISEARWIEAEINGYDMEINRNNGAR